MKNAPIIWGIFFVSIINNHTLAKNNKYEIFFIIFSLLFSIYSFAQNGKLKGNITDIKSNEALIGVNVSIQNAREGTTTDIDGNFELDLTREIYYGV